MADTGWKSPGTVVDDSSVGTKAWANPDNAKTSNNVYSTAAGGTGGGTSHYLKSTNFNMSVPAGATIDGILIEFERKRGANADVDDSGIYIVKASGAYGSTNKASDTWSITEAYHDYGGAADLWGETWTAEDINDVDFGVGLSIFMDAGFCAGSVDHVRIKVFYTPGLNVKLNVGDSWKDVDEIKINVGGSWKTVTQIQINISDVWKTIFG